MATIATTASKRASGTLRSCDALPVPGPGLVSANEFFSSLLGVFGFLGGIDILRCIVELVEWQIAVIDLKRQGREAGHHQAAALIAPHIGFGPIGVPASGGAAR